MNSHAYRRHLRVATYNVHKCRGIDRRVRPDRIVAVLRELDADIIALQEVVSHESRSREDDQARFVAEELGFHFAFGENRLHEGRRYGNVVLTRFPIQGYRNFDITAGGREHRGCLRTDVSLNRSTLHVFNVHFGTRYFEQCRQVEKLFEDGIVVPEGLSGPRIVLGDFNEWIRGSVSPTLSRHLDKAHQPPNRRRSHTFPSRLPLFGLDQIYFDRSLQLASVRRYKSRSAMVASDHLPLIADFRGPGIDAERGTADSGKPSAPGRP